MQIAKWPESITELPSQCPCCESEHIIPHAHGSMCSDCRLVVNTKGERYKIAESKLKPPTPPQPTRPINLEALANIPKFKLEDFNTEKILVPEFDLGKSEVKPIPSKYITAKRFKLVDAANAAKKGPWWGLNDQQKGELLSQSAIKSIQKEEDQNIFAALKTAADKLKEVTKSINNVILADIQAAVASDPNVTIITKSRWDHSECNDAGDMFEHLKLEYD